ncbi:MAG: hypothetical protein E7650_01300 [Ruminococcaceae bacterium]|nr:hypothetical protein [Oscillospiraceae bacterium]
MKNLLSATFARLFKGKLFWIGMLAMGGLGAVATIARARDAYVLQDMGYDRPDGLLFIGLTYFLITVAAFDGLFIGAEHADGTWRNKLIVGQGRVQIYLTYLIVTTAATMLMHLVYIGVVLGLSAPLLNPFLTLIKVNVVFFFCSLATVVAMNALMVTLCMLIQNRAVVAVGAMLLAIGLMMGGMAIYQMLCAPEFLSGPATVVNGVLMPSPEPVPNPKYLTGAKRAFFQFLHEFLPGGQAITIGMTGELPANVWRLPVFSALLTLLSTLGGAWGFCRRDLK